MENYSFYFSFWVHVDYYYKLIRHWYYPIPQTPMHLGLIFYRNECRKFEDIFDVDHFIDYLKDDVRIVRDIPEWFTDKSELLTSIRSDVFLFYFYGLLSSTIMIVFSS